MQTPISHVYVRLDLVAPVNSVGKCWLAVISVSAYLHMSTATLKIEAEGVGHRQAIDSDVRALKGAYEH